MQATQKPLSDNRTVRCDCGTPLLRRIGSRTLELMKYHQGQPSKMRLSYTGNKSEVACEKCSRRVEFLTNTLSLGLSYAVAAPEKAG